ncbi:MAG: hypothetical protein EXQ85_09835 [Alphaproteobacteria bacterium]|nr:hypothetical protein [Alphaproteobacteria bacterium]
MELDLEPTLAILTLAIAVFALAVWQHSRIAPGHPSLVPWGGVQYLALLAAILMAAHLVTLLSGMPLAGRASPPR